MDTSLLSAFDTPLTLVPGRLRRLPPEAPALRLRVLAGGVWLTVQGSPQDHFLAAGMALELPAHADALVEPESRLGEGPAVLLLERLDAPRGPVARAPWWRRLPRLRAGAAAGPEPAPAGGP